MEGSMAEPETSLEALPLAWPRAKRILFRFICLYTLLYVFPFPLDDTIGISIPVSEAWDQVVPWVGQHVLHLPYEITFRPNGSGDTTYSYVQVFVILVLSVSGSLLWSLADRRRIHYRGLARWLAIGSRYYLAFVMLSYGIVKIFKSQFPFPGLERLLEPYGDSSPMGLLWAFMGYSPAYNIFAGGAEALGGLLLLFRRTTTLGAVVAIGVLANIVMLNFCYDVPVKLFSVHLILVAIALAALDGRRLLNAFVLNRPAPAADLSPHFASRRWHLASRGVKTVLVGFVLFQGVSSARSTEKQWGDRRARPPLYGIYSVETFTRDGEVVPPLVTETRRWRRFIVDWEGVASLELMDGKFERVVFKVDAAAKKATFSTYRRFAKLDVSLKEEPKPADPTFAWTYDQPAKDVLVMQGELEGHQLAVTMRASDPRDFLLVQRGFHWINEVPFNR
jgi:uncharacterized membrane protein YphA (DoxX/SURF4 family)